METVKVGNKKMEQRERLVELLRDQEQQATIAYVRGLVMVQKEENAWTKKLEKAADSRLAKVIFAESQKSLIPRYNHLSFLRGKKEQSEIMVLLFRDNHSTAELELALKYLKDNR